MLHLLVFQAYPVFLAPLYQFALEVHLLVGHLVQVDDARQDAILHKLHAGVVAAVQIDGAHQCLEGVASHVVVVCLGVGVGTNQFHDAHLLCQFVQCFALHQFASGVGEKALALAFKVAINDISHHCVKDGIAQKLQSLIVQCLALGHLSGHALVHQCQLVIADVAGIEACYVIE